MTARKTRAPLGDRRYAANRPGEPERADKAFWAKCPGCGHCWPAAYYPMELEKVARLAMKARCPKGCTARPVVPKQSNGELLEDQA